MKKIISLLLLSLLLCGTVTAATNGEYKGYPIVHITYEGKTLAAEDVPAILYHGRTMMPLGMLRKAGFDVIWDPATYTADIKPKTPDKSMQKVKTPDEIQALDKAVGWVTINIGGQWYFHGSGFVINPQGLFITNYHVAEHEGDLRDMRVNLNGKEYKVGKAVFKDKTKDLYGAYLEGDEVFPYLKVNTVPPAVGDKVYALGNPDGRKNVLTKGEVTIEPYLIQGNVILAHSAKIEPGSDGGVLLNEYGEAIGVTDPGAEATYVAKGILNVKYLYEQSFSP